MYYDGEKNHDLNSIFDVLQAMMAISSKSSSIIMTEKFLSKFKNRLFIDIVLKHHDNKLPKENITLKQAYNVAQVRKAHDKRDVIFGTLNMTNLPLSVECFSMDYPNLIKTACKLSLSRGDASWLPLYGGPVADTADYYCIVDPFKARSCLSFIEPDINYTKIVEICESGVKLVVKKHIPVAASP